MNNMNTRNYGVVIGRLVRQPKVYENRDGSHKVLYTLAVSRNFSNKEGKRDSDFVNLEAFLPARSRLDQSVYSCIRVGELMAVRYTIRTSTYTDANGEGRFGTSLLTQDVELLEGKPADAEQPARGRETRETKGGVELQKEDELPF
ncbi:single-stranded DNA-binding protein [uncultured Pseudoflavonifractor sp.]|uniref:single-stranded DNA-binding protein n=1 Tax=uncultured Pseudoflavonifractor sp. TaxID=1221379 RepID=UPI00260055A9|nr:single-stranded DNA-binding protein [uncultured Pseudoflavonifractor sp.]